MWTTAKKLLRALPIPNARWAHTRERAFRRSRHHRDALRARLPALAARLGRTRSVGILLTEHAGDVAACEPVARQIRAREPDALIVWVVNRRYREIVDAFADVDLVFPIDCLIEATELRDGVFDETHNLHFDGRGCPGCAAGLGNPDAPPDVNPENYYDYGSLLHVMQRVGRLPVDDRSAPRFSIPSGVARRVDALNLGRDYVVAHAVSNEADRNWTPAGWTALARRVRDRFGLRTIEVGGASGFAEHADASVSLDLCGRLSWLETAEVIRRARLFVGIDSGPAHFANAVDTPGVILLGKYRRFTHHVPYSGGYGDGTRATLVRAAGPSPTLGLDEVYAAVAARLELAGPGRQAG